MGAEEELKRCRSSLRRSARTLAPRGGQAAGGGMLRVFRPGGRGRGRLGEPGWAAAALMRGKRGLQATAVVEGEAGWHYEPGLLALREGPLLEAAIRTLPERPEVLIVNASGRDHPRGAGLALHLGAVLELPSLGITDRPLLADGRQPEPERGSTSPLLLGGHEVARRLRTRTNARPVVVPSGLADRPRPRRHRHRTAAPAERAHPSRCAGPERPLATRAG